MEVGHDWGHSVEVGESGFKRARVLEASGPICLDQINRRGIGGDLWHMGLSSKFLKLYIW